jgi:DNA helicase-2/ATP-dependent DNA helicase PcrA
MTDETTYADSNDNFNDNDEVHHTTTSIVLEGLNPSQVEAVTQPTSAVTRVVAGPGSGKTRVLTCRIAYLLEHDRRSRILAVTFTRKASGEMQKRVETLLRQRQSVEDDVSNNASYDDNRGVVEETTDSLPRGLERVTLGTFHSVCSKILRYNGNLLATLPSVLQDIGNRQDAVVNLDGSFAILDQSDQLRILKECLDEAEIDLKKSAIKPLAILSAISTLKENRSQGIDPYRTDDKRKPVPKAVRFAQEIYGIYREKLCTNNAVDFDDLILMTRELLMKNRELRERLHKRWPHILVDEFQDTSRSQMDLVKLLTSSSLLIVGDADQSIYSWRGAHAGSISDFATEFQRYAGDGVSTVYLKENYR